jgi:PHD/YefM family antitoxin component YafN of YafNO toxin-antitoxin module
MAITTLSSREFNQKTSEAKKAAENGPVFITDRGRTAHVLITFDEYLRITDKGKSILALLAMPGDMDIDFEPEPLPDLARGADFS